MIGALKQTTSRFAIAAAAGLFTGGIALTPVQAASLGGDCCADLEERVAELEATTVRKGNRKVSVQLSGQVVRSILFWDDGYDDDITLSGGGVTHSRFRIKGSATISPGRKAGYYYEVDLGVAADKTSNCDGNDSGIHCMKVPSQDAASGLAIRHQDIWFSQEGIGKVSLGHSNTASNGTAEVDLSGVGLGSLASPMGDTAEAYQFRTSTGTYSGITIGSVTSNQDGGSRKNRIRYDTPSIAGFTLSTSFADDDYVDGAIRFKKEWNSVRCAAALGVFHETKEKDDDKWNTSGSASCIHTPSGLNVTVAFGDEDNEESSDVDTNYIFIKAGIYRRWNSHGKTAIAIAYGNYNDSVTLYDDTDVWGLEITQYIDAAAVELYASYLNYEYSDASVTTYSDFDVVTMGARIKF